MAMDAMRCRCEWGPRVTPFVSKQFIRPTRSQATIGRALSGTKVGAMESLDGADAGPTSTTSRERLVEGAARATRTSPPHGWGGHDARFRQADGSR